MTTLSSATARMQSYRGIPMSKSSVRPRMGEAVHLARDCQPDVVLMDLGMPRMGGIEATRRRLAVHPSAAVIIPTMSDDDSSPLAATKRCPRLAAQGIGRNRCTRRHRRRRRCQRRRHQRWLCPTPHRFATKTVSQLTPRELEILDLVASGATNPMIGRRLRGSGPI